MSERDPHGKPLPLDVDCHRQLADGRWAILLGRPASDLFKPRPNDHGLLSLTDGRLRSPEEAWRFAKGRGFGTKGTSTAAAQIYADAETPVSSDPLTADRDGLDDPAHAVADFRGVPRKKWGARAKPLRRKSRITFLDPEFDPTPRTD